VKKLQTLREEQLPCAVFETVHELSKTIIFSKDIPNIFTQRQCCYVRVNPLKSTSILILCLCS